MADVMGVVIGRSAFGAARLTLRGLPKGAMMSDHRIGRLVTRRVRLNP